MPKLNGKLPTYRRHRPSGQAVVTLSGKDFYLGPWNTKASRAEYDRLTAEWLAAGRNLPAQAVAADMTVSELVNRFRTHVSGYYRYPDGTPTKEVALFKYALSLLHRVYGHTLAKDFGPLAIQSLRQKMVERGWSRLYVNQQVSRVKRMFRWAVAQELVSPSVLHGLQAVEGLKRGRTDARESEPVKPVADAVVDATMPFLPPTVQAMVEVQRQTGMRPGEVCQLRRSDLEITGPLWVYRPARHKMAYRGRSRVILIGKRGQDALAPFLKPDLHAYVFSPGQAMAERWQARHEVRVTPEGYGNTTGTNRKANPKWKPGEQFTTEAYERAIRYACQQAFPAPDDVAADDARLAEWRREHTWAPNQLRHNFATRVRREHGLEAAQVLLGHARADVTQVYAERDLTKAAEVLAKIG